MEKADNTKYDFAMLRNVLQLKNPTIQYRISPNGLLQCKYSGKWRTLCKHEIRKDSCTECRGELKKDPIVVEELNIQKAELMIQFQMETPQYIYRVSNGELYRATEVNWNIWRNVCEHNTTRDSCKYCNPNYNYIHGIRAYTCILCGTGRCVHKKLKHLCAECSGASLCVHNVAKTHCVPCHGSQVCEHNRLQYQCYDCGGGGICEHSHMRSTCVQCKGASICEHDRVRWECKQCDGNHKCEHGNVRRYCKPCGGPKICPCGERYKNCYMKTGLCTKCDPNYVPTPKGKSKIACLFMDEYEKYLNHKIQHIHYNSNDNVFEGVEHQVLQWQRKFVDGFYTKPDNSKVAIEFLGNEYHGHPSKWHHDHTLESYYHIPYKTLFEETELKMQKLKDLGYTVVYVWQYDYKRKKAHESIDSICFVFDGKLKWTEYI